MDSRLFLRVCNGPAAPCSDVARHLVTAILGNPIGANIEMEAAI